MKSVGLNLHPDPKYFVSLGAAHDGKAEGVDSGGVQGIVG